MTKTFDGSDYVQERDEDRLQTQLEVIESLMEDHEWRTLGEIEQETGYPQASISAQLRNLRKPRFGARQIAKQHLFQGLYAYQLVN